MDPRGLLCVFLVCLLATLVAASEAESRLEEASLKTATAGSSDANRERRNATAASTDGITHGSQGERERVERTDNEHLQQEEEDYEGKDEGEDEYEDELKAVAESHEAMSRDDTRNSNASTAASTGLQEGASIGANNFDSREVLTVNTSDEDVSSNEAITDELVEKYDQEVAELLKYKKERSSDLGEDSRTKTKRVPTVKKELSTQKEILIGSNETQVPKSLVPPEDTLNQLNQESDLIRRRNVLSNAPIKSQESVYPDGVLNNRDLESEREGRKKLDKRQESFQKDLKSLTGKLRELGAQGDALAEILLKFLLKLSEDPSGWERVQKLLVNAGSELNLSRNSLETANKRSFVSASTLFPVTSEPSESRKSRKKLKKKKKKPKHRFSTTTLTPVPATPPLLTTTEAPWQTTPVQWRLVAERLFGPPWQQDILEGEKATGSSRYTAQQSSKSLPSIRELIEQNNSDGGSNLKTFGSNRKAISQGQVGQEVGKQRVVRFGKIAARQPGHVQPQRDFPNAYEGPTDPERMPDYDIPEAYRRPRYPQLSSRDFLRRREEEYPGELNADEFPSNQEYLPPPPREFGLSKSWPDLSYRYSPWRIEQRPPIIPVPSENWSWRQAEPKFWPARSFLPVEKNYWSRLDADEEVDREGDPEKMWQQQQNRGQNSWNRESPSWPVEKSRHKVQNSWQEEQRPVKLYDREPASNGWEKSKNRSELNKSSAKPLENKEKVVLPQITMKTWNSLTSDPATWPHKLPGAKPWPKDENGKSYNPNADLVKKLGLDKQNGNAGWSKEESEKPNGERKAKAGDSEKQSRIFSSKEEELQPRAEASKYKSTDDRSNFSDHRSRSEESKPWTMLSEPQSRMFASKEELPQTEASKYKSSDDRTNFSEYKGRSGEAKPWSGSKDWTKTQSSQENMQGDDPGGWRRKFEGKNSWTNEAALPKIQSIGAWVMSADQSTWKPYQIKPIDTSEENPNRRWSKAQFARNGDAKWNKGSWSEKLNDSWMDSGLWPEKSELWPTEKSGKGSWFAKSKDSDGWTSKSSNPDLWKAKGEWLSKPEATSWLGGSKMNDNWSSRLPWATKSNESWIQKVNDNLSNKYNGDSWSGISVKEKEEDSVDWSRKNDQNSWNSKANDLSPWQQKMNDEWSYGKASSTGTWPTKWKQFAYHRVTAMPISKPGTTADAASPKSKNAFVAVSAVSSPKYVGSEWRKNEEDNRNENGRAEEQERSSNQVQVGLERPIYAWKKDAGIRGGGSTKANSSDPLENQLEALRRTDFWSYKENEVEKRLTSTSATTETASTVGTNNSTSTTAHRRGVPMTGNGNGLLETNRRTISMK